MKCKKTKYFDGRQFPDFHESFILFCQKARRDVRSIAFLVANDLGVLLTSYFHEKMEPPFSVYTATHEFFYQRLVSLTN